MGKFWLDLVASSFFCFIQALVGKVDKPIELIGLIGKDGNTLAHSWSRDFFVFGMTEDQFLHSFLNALSYLMRFIPSGTWQGDCKFFSTPAANKITFFDILLNGFA